MRVVLPLLSLLSATFAQTNFTGDILRGAAIIDVLDLNDVPHNAVTRYYIRVPSVSGGWDMQLPVYIARGPPETLESGARLSISSSIHGDELNPVRVAQRVLEKLELLDLSKLNGTIIGTPTLNPTGNYLSQRNYYTASGSGTLSNLNRLFPGSETGSAPSLHAYTLWQYLWSNTSHVTHAIDMHTTSTGAEAPMWVYADYRAPYVQRLAELAQPDVLKIDAGEPGSVETTFVKAGVPAVTLELGQAKVWSDDLIQRGVEYIDRVMVDLGLLTFPLSSVTAEATGGSGDGEIGPYNSSTQYTVDLSRTVTGDVFHSLPSRNGGFVETLVNVLDNVTAGQEVAIIRNAWGDVLDRVIAPVDGRVQSVARDPATEPGRDAVQLVYNASSIPIEGCEGGCIVSGRGVVTSTG